MPQADSDSYLLADETDFLATLFHAKDIGMGKGRIPKLIHHGQHTPQPQPSRALIVPLAVWGLGFIGHLY